MLDEDALEDRASDVRQRLEDLGLGDGLSENDLLGGFPREPLRSCCLKLADMIWAQLCSINDAWINLIPIRSAVQDVQFSANTDAAAKEHLDRDLVSLAAAINGNASSGKTQMSRLDAVEILVGVVQACALATADGAPSGLAIEGSGQEESIRNGDAEGCAMECDDATTLSLSSILQSIAQMVGVNPRQPTAACTAREVATAVQGLVSRLPPSFFEAVVPPGSLNDAQMAMLADIDAALNAENALRRRMLMERVKVTLQSFLWSPRLAEGEAKRAAETAMQQILSEMTETPSVSLAEVSSATLGDIMTVAERATSSTSGRDGALKARVKDVLIGSVPDRGGRTDGQRKIALPEWSERKVTPGGGKRRRR